MVSPSSVRLAAALALGALLGAGFAVGSRADGARDPTPWTSSSRTRGPWTWDLPLGFPVPRVPADNPMSRAKVELGRHLFYDPRLSGGGEMSCATCHQQARAFTDGRARSVGETGERHPRGAMSLANVAYAPSLTWADPDLASLEAQALVPLTGTQPIEMGAGGREPEILARLAADSTYRDLFAASFPDVEEPIAWPRVTAAIAAFERTLISGGSAYDRFVFLDLPFTEPAKRGMALFESLGCEACHGGFTFAGTAVWRDSEDAEPLFANTGLYNLLDADGKPGAYPADNTGRMAHSRAPSDMGSFRVPTLRNIAVTAPYMHDGSIATLEGVIAHYAAGGRTANRHKASRLRGFEISAAETADLVAFLESLTDRAFLTDERFGDPWLADRPPTR